MIAAEYYEVKFCEHCKLELSAEALKCENCKTMVDLNPLNIEVKREETDEEESLSENEFQSEFEAESCEETNIPANSSIEVLPEKIKEEATQALVSGTEDTADSAKVTLDKGDKCEKSSKYTTVEQFAVLIEEFRKRPDMAKGISVVGSNRQQWEEQWVIIRDRLNSCGPPVRNISEWKKVWSDLKSRTKKKLAENASEIRASVGGPACLSFLAPTEQEVDKILSLSANFLATGSVHGAHKRKKRSYKELSDEQAPASASSTLPVPDSPASAVPKVRKTDDDEFLLLLRQQTKTQQEVSTKLDKISDSMARIAKALELLVSNPHESYTTSQRICRNVSNASCTKKRRGKEEI